MTPEMYWILINMLSCYSYSVILKPVMYVCTPLSPLIKLMKKFLKPMIHCSTFVEQQMYPTNVEKCIMYCWMLKYAIQHVEWQLIVVEKNRAWVYSFQQVAACWTTSTNRFRVWCHAAWWKDQTWRLKLGLYWNMELWECVNMAW